MVPFPETGGCAIVEPCVNFLPGGISFAFLIAMIAESWPTRSEQHIQSINSTHKVLSGRIRANIVVQITQKEYVLDVLHQNELSEAGSRISTYNGHLV